MTDSAATGIVCGPKRIRAVRSSELLEAKRRYRNSRRRARYWSGTVTFCPWLRSVETRSSRLSEKYELAMADCDVWERTISALTGKVLKHYDPRSAFAERFTKLFASRPNAKLSDRKDQHGT